MKAAIIFNPMAGRWRAAQSVQWAVEALQALGWAVTLKTTQYAGQTSELAAAALEEGVTAIFVAGGDGTVSAIANKLAGSDLTLGVLPVGTANLWAIELGLIQPRETLESVKRRLSRRRNRRRDG